MSFTLAHLSDAHIGPLPKPLLRELAGKRLTGYINWQRRHSIHNMDVLGEIIADIKHHAPDHIAMTGDIMNIGLPGEFTAARSWLQTLGRPEDVSFVPGNHDNYVRHAVPLIPQVFAPWCSNDGEHHTSFPYLRRRGDAALIGVSSAIPTGPFLASGAIGKAQMAALENLLRECAAQGLFRIVMIHHPPWRGGASFGRGLRDAAAFEAVIARCGAELILHGHNHKQLVKTLPSPGADTPCIGVASASAVPGTPRHRAAWHFYRIEREGNGWRVEARARGYREGADRIGELDPITWR